MKWKVSVLGFLCQKLKREKYKAYIEKQKEVIELAKSKQAKMNKIIAIGIAVVLIVTSITTLISVISLYL